MTNQPNGMDHAVTLLLINPTLTTSGGGFGLLLL